MRNRILLCLAHMSGKEQDYIKEAFDQNWAVPLEPNVNGFEKDMENFVNEVKSESAGTRDKSTSSLLTNTSDLDKKVVALSAGTAAVHLALHAIARAEDLVDQNFSFI